MPILTCEVSQSLLDAIDKLVQRTGDSRSSIVSHALAEALGVDHAALFQVSAAGALVAGVGRGSITVAELATHGDFGLGTFDDFDGEMVMLEGTAYRAAATGVSVADPDTRVPFAVVTEFSAQQTSELSAFGSGDELLAQLDAVRSTDNEFFAVRIDGVFSGMKTRVACRTPGGTLIEVAENQAVFEFTDLVGTVVGFWSPGYTSSMTVVGWHLHFLSDDRRTGGHMLDVQGGAMDLQMQRLTDFHVAFPETVAFMEADMSIDHSQELADAETDH